MLENAQELFKSALDKWFNTINQAKFLIGYNSHPLTKIKLFHNGQNREIQFFIFLVKLAEM
jgi:hypothetical protein